ncbi:DNA-directed RNA polymerase II subunit rpb1-like [Gracilinanus agilis]|uniref:DNA-directed RNA polymerase II subunit rpb1-like n=1 Tax=Gracilinanus agilis TaxID=191870 RepID=UPI001CFF5125|nr:DNA-directed RNA polymerase II subunit rpb1-like [Gracilinanus agilis]
MTGWPLLCALLLPLASKLDGVGGNNIFTAIMKTSSTDFSSRSQPDATSPTDISHPTYSPSSPSVTPSSITSHSSTPSSAGSSNSISTSHSVITPTNTPTNIPSTPFHSVTPSLSDSVSHTSPTSYPTPSHSGSPSSTSSHSHSTSHNSRPFSPTPPEGSSPSSSISSGAPTAATDRTLSTTKLGISASAGGNQRNPGVVIVVCLFVSILVLGSVVVAVKCCRKDMRSFQKMDEVPMETVREEAPFARYPPQ